MIVIVISYNLLSNREGDELTAEFRKHRNNSAICMFPKL